MAEKPKTEVHTDNELPPSVLSGRVSFSSLRGRSIPLMVWIWQHDKKTEDYNKIILHCV